MADETTIEQPQIQEQAPIPQETPQPDPPTKKMYDLLVKGQLYSKSYDDFQKQYSTPESIDKLYNGLSGAQLYSKSKDDFYNQYFPSTKTGSTLVEKEPSIEDIRKNKDVFENPIPSKTETVDPMSGGSITTPGTSPEEIKAAKDQFDAQTKGLSDKWGIESEKVQKTLSDFPDENDPVRLQAKAQLQKDNPESYNRLVAADENMHLLFNKAGQNVAHEYNSLQGTPEQPIQNLEHLQSNIEKQKDIINLNLSGEEQQRALRNLEINRSSSFNVANPEIIKEYNLNPFKDQLDATQFAGLKSLQSFNQNKYNQYIKLLSLPSKEDTEHTASFNPLTGEMTTDVKETEATVSHKIAIENIKQDLADRGRSNTVRYLKELNTDISKKYDMSSDPIEKKDFHDQYNKNLIILNAIQDDAKKDGERYPYSSSLRFDNQVKELTQDPGFNAIEYMAAKTAHGFEKSVNALTNTATALFESDQSKSELELQKKGEAIKDESDLYLPESYKSEGSPSILKFDKDLQSEANKIANDNTLTESEKTDKLTQLLKNNQDKIQSITNPNYGKSANFFSKATLYRNAGALGELIPIAVEQYALGGLGVGKLLSSALPMYLTSQDDYYKKAVTDGISNPSAYAALHSSVMMIAGMINPDLSIVKRSLGMGTPLGKLVSGLSEEEWNGIINSNKPLLNKIQNSIKSVGIEAAKIGGVYGAGTSIVNDLIDKGIYNKNISGQDIVNNAVKATRDITMSSLALFGLNAISNFKSASPETKGRIWEIGHNPEIGKEQVDDAVRTGEISKDVGNQRKEIIKQISKLVNSVPSEDSKGRPLNDKQRSDYLYNLVIKSKVDDIKSDLPEAQKDKLEAIKRSVDIDNNAILDPKSEKENLMQRKRELTDLLSPDAEGKSTLTPLEKKTHQTELDDINEKLDNINSPKTQTNGEETKDASASETEGERQIGKPEGAENQQSVVGAAPSLLESRHADTPRDERGITSGQDHSGLSEDGIADANKLAESVKGKGITKVISSDLERGKETAKIVADKLGATVEHDPNLRAWDLGEFDGTKDKDWKELQKYFVEHPNEKEYQGKKLNESFNEYKDRVIKVRESLEKEGPSTLLVNHSNNMMLWNAYEKNGRQWNDKTSQDYLNGEKPKPATIQERRPEEVLQREPGNDGTAGGRRGQMESGEQGNNPTGESGQQPQKENESSGEEEGVTKMANAINDAHIEGKFGTAALDKVVEKLQDTDLKRIYEKVKQKIIKGTIDLKNLRERLITTKTGSEEDQAALLYDLANLKEKENHLQKEIINEPDEAKQKELQKQLMDVQNDMMDNALANRSIGRSASTIFRLRQLWVNREANIVDMKKQYMAAKGLKELNPDQEKEIKEAYDKIKEAKANMESARMELQKVNEENQKLKTENEKLKSLDNNSKRQHKADRAKKVDEAIKDSQDRVKKAKDNLRKLGGSLSAGFNPQIAIEISKIAAEKFYQGVVKLDELIKNVLDEVKDVFSDWTEQDVRNHLFTTKDNNGKEIPSPISEEYVKSKDLSTSDAELREKMKAYGKLQKEYALKQYEWQRDRRMDMMDKRPLKERIIDNILRWQRFAVLSYPTTFVKLAGVVASQLTLKPIKFLIQKLITANVSKGLGISGKQSIWGDPTWKALGKYYSAFIQNFSINNLKEHFSGIDTKEILYGKGMMYDEWPGAKGLLDMPGRSHGYIKSFIKNPEFQFAHEQQLTYHISKMAEISKEFENPKLTDTEKQTLKDEYDRNDVTNEDVMERINKLSLDHGKWAILMNDNKFVDKFRQWTDQNGITGALLKSEAPVLKIPINYVSRAFATKYGIIQALLGKGKDKMPSVFRIVFQGSKDLTEEQANLLGRTITMGSMGAAFFTLGYLNRKHVKENDDGSVDIFGHHISKNLIHSPEFDSFFSGATTANGFSKEKKKDQGVGHWIKNFVESDIEIAKKSPFTSMLQYGFIPTVATALISKKDNTTKMNKIEDAVFKKVSDMIIPGFVKQPAGWMDTKQPGVHPMSAPKTRVPKGNELERFWQTIELGLPELRKNVPLKKKK